MSDLSAIKLPAPPQLAAAREKTCWQCGRTFVTAQEVCPEDGARLLDLVLEGRDLLIGQTLDERYEVNRELAEGGMGKVYAAFDRRERRDVAIKVLKADYLRDETIRKRFMHEARIVANLSHPNVVNMYDFGQRPNGNFYMVMELLKGESLAERLARKFLSYREIVSIVPRICDALAEAHARGVIHRDLKPENIFIVTEPDGSERAKLIDFGVARQAERQTLTQAGSLWGTPAYMSPEQCRGEQVSEGGDIYAMGVILYELVCGHLPFTAQNQMGYAVKHLHASPRAMKSAPGLTSPPDALDALVLTALGKTPADRPASMRAFADALDALVAEHFQDEAILNATPALEVDPEALKLWIAEGDEDLDEPPPMQRQTLEQSPPGIITPLETQAVMLEPILTSAAAPSRRVLGIAAAFVALLLVSVVAVLAMRLSEEPSEATALMNAPSSAALQGPLDEASAERVALSRDDAQLKAEGVSLTFNEALEESAAHSASSMAVGQGAVLAAHVMMAAERLAAPIATSAQIELERATKKRTRRPRRRGRIKERESSREKADVRDVLRKTY